MTPNNIISRVILENTTSGSQTSHSCYSCLHDGKILQRSQKVCLQVKFQGVDIQAKKNKAVLSVIAKYVHKT